jgi:hypothetical protein
MIPRGETVIDSARTEIERQLAEADRESDDLQLQMVAVRQAVADDVDQRWPSPWKSPETVDAKLRARLAGHAAYQGLRGRQRELDSLRRSLTGRLGALGSTE